MHNPRSITQRFLRRSLGPVLALVLLVAPLPQPAPAFAAEEWPQYRHDAQRSGRTGTAVPRGTDGRLHLQWAYSLGERVEVEVEPIVAGGKLFLGAMNGVFTALNAADGRLAWEFVAGGPIPHTAAYADGRVFFGSLDGAVYALDAGTGRQLWKVVTGGPVYAAPAVASATVYIGTTAGRFLALDAATGAERWHFPAGDTRLATAFTGAAAVSPDGKRIFVGNEDLTARALDAASGVQLWQHQLAGTGMRGIHPVVADDGAVVFFQTAKAGNQSYVPTEGYPAVAPGTNAVQTWNRYYQAHPERRATYFLNAATGAELWDPARARYVPLPIPYWGLLAPVLDSGGNAVFPSPGGAQGDGADVFSLDHDSRLMRVDLQTGAATEIASRTAFQHRVDENGRAAFAGGDYLTTISEDLGVYQPASGLKSSLFGNPDSLFGSHMDPLAPLPSKHLWRYGGTIAMGGVPGASPPIVVGDTVYYVSYGWVFALAAANRGKDPTGASPLPFPSRDRRLSTLTYPRSNGPGLAAVRAELEQRVADIVAAAPLPPVAKFDQPGNRMLYDTATFQVFGMPAEQILVLSRALPYVSPSLQARLRATLKAMASQELFNPRQYEGRRDCLVYGQPGVKSGAICDAQDQIVAAWWADNELLVGERLYAMAAYAEATGDWAAVDAAWGLIKSQFATFSSAYDPQLGFCRFKDWHVGKLGIASQIGAAAGVLRMAVQRGDSTTAAGARTLLNNLLATRVRLARVAQTQYDAGKLAPLPLRLDPDGVPNRDDIFKYNDPGELIPLLGDRSRATDTRQVNSYDGVEPRLHSGAGFMYYPALVGYSSLYPELAERLKADLLAETRQYVQSYEVNAPWWWMSDLAHHTTAGGEHLWHSPTLAHDLFQVKAFVLDEDLSALLRQLPEPMSLNPRYDFFRLDNLVALLIRGGPALTLDATPRALPKGARTRLLLSFATTGAVDGAASATITLPQGLRYVDGSATASAGSLTTSPGAVTWSGSISAAVVTTVQLDALVDTDEVRRVVVRAQVVLGAADPLLAEVPLFLNGRAVWLPAVRRS